MFNYANLCDVEFEYLCKDVLERYLDVKLKCFAPGRDGGIDLTDNTSTHNIVVQVKHYINSTFSNLRTSLQKEVEKVKSLKPNQYYVCCAMKLTHSNIKEIYEMFSDYMESDKNIFTLIEIDDLLNEVSYSDIVQKTYKLWLSASNVLSLVQNQHVFLDCEVLMSDINEEIVKFVETSSYEICRECLEKNRIIMLVGAPGVGKTTTSKMLILYYANKGYRVRYSTNGEISDIKNAISLDKETKEVILLDDCFGQHYFNMKEQQGNELLALIKYIRMNMNKVIILNSRVAIYNEAKERNIDLNKFIEEDKLKLHVIDMDQISILDKARIFYNHLYFLNIPNTYYNNIKTGRNYKKIITHKNYNPRIIEHVTRKVNYASIDPDNYANYIIDVLDKPVAIWKNEFEDRLCSVDRAFMYTLYSITDTTCTFDEIERGFNSRLLKMQDVDTTKNNFNDVIQRLNGSLINFYDVNGIPSVGVINPSVNDYMKLALKTNNAEIMKIRESITEYRQLRRCYSKEEYAQVLSNLMNSGAINELYFTSDTEKIRIIMIYTCHEKILHISYKQIYYEFVNGNKYEFVKNINERKYIIEGLLSKTISEYYCIDQIPNIYNFLYSFLGEFNFDDLVDIFENFEEDSDKINVLQQNAIEIISGVISDAIENQLSEIDVVDYCIDHDINEILIECTECNGICEELNEERAVETLYKLVCDDIYSDISDNIDRLPKNISSKISFEMENIDISLRDIEGVVESYMYLDHDWDDYGEYDYDTPDSLENDMIDIMFDR